MRLLKVLKSSAESVGIRDIFTGGAVGALLELLQTGLKSLPVAGMFGLLLSVLYLGLALDFLRL